MGEGIRLNKYLSDAGICSRREADRLIEEGRVLIDGVPASMGTKVKPGQTVCCNGQTVGGKDKPVFLVVNKPRGIVCTTSDKDRAENIVEFLNYPQRIYPVGRLDKDTVGLLLITNDGNLAHRLLSPKHHVDKCYFAKVQGNVTKEDAEKFAEGVNIGTEDEPEITMPGKLDIIKSDDLSEIRLTIQEGKFHQVKRMFQAVGKEVVYLKRERMGSLLLDDNLAEGEYRMLTEEELKNLLF